MIIDARKDSSGETRIAVPQVAHGPGPKRKGIKNSSQRALPTGDAEKHLETGSAQSRNPLRQGVLTEVLNPKTALFFLSFIPQFVNHSQGHVFEQFIVLGAISVTLNTSADILVTMFAAPLGRRIRESARFRRRQRTLTGAVMIGLGTYLALGEAK